MYTKIRLKIRDFFRRNRKTIIIIIVVWAIVLTINYTLKAIPKIEIPKTTYEPHTAVMDNSKVPDRLQNPIEQEISDFVSACNKRDYEKAYNQLTKECRETMFPDFEYFKSYVNLVFDREKDI